ncbi:hypothetical protein AwDysgo_16810 [Bacteroidales bacterium]|nr:hypothetical protein AwDysgo_16810 [Bacteroidales bacterium]
MRKKTQVLKYLFSDFFSAALAWALFNIVRYYEMAQFEGFDSLGLFVSYQNVILGQLFIPILWLAIYYYSGYYNEVLAKSRLSEFFTTFQSVFIGTLIIFFGLLLNKLPRFFHIYYEQFLLLFGLTFSITYFFRLLITQTASNKIHGRRCLVKALIIGSRENALVQKAALEKPSDALGFAVVGYVDSCFHEKNGLSVDITDSTILSLGDFEDLEKIIQELGVEEIIVAIGKDNNEELLPILYSLYKYKLPIKLPITSAKMLTGGIKTKTITGVPFVDVTANNFSESGKNIKNSLDKIVSLFVIILLSPLYIYLALRIKLDSEGSVFFLQERIGYMGKPFYICKFRTMREDAEKEGPLLSSKNDKRITNYGRMMRKYRLDELPQFWNVLKGDMSLVGPRPERKYFIDKIVQKAPYFYLLHNVKPGITSWGMVKYGYASDVDHMIERSQFDLLYYENMSIFLDVKILIYTVRTILTGKGV